MLLGGELLQFLETEEKPLAFLLFNSFSGQNCISMARNFANLLLQLALEKIFCK